MFFFALLPLGVAVSLEGAERSAATPSRRPPAEKRVPAKVQSGLAAYYHDDFQGLQTANGEQFDHDTLTAAHKFWPFGTLVRVTNLANDRSVIVRINDRGPMERNRVIDLTRRAAEHLGFIHRGLTKVKIEIVNSHTAGERKEISDEKSRELPNAAK